MTTLVLSGPMASVRCTKADSYYREESGLGSLPFTSALMRLLLSRIAICSPMMRESNRISRQNPFGWAALGTLRAEMLPLWEQVEPSCWVGVSSPRAFRMKHEGLELVNSSWDVPRSEYRSA